MFNGNSAIDKAQSFALDDRRAATMPWSFRHSMAVPLTLVSGL